MPLMDALRDDVAAQLVGNGARILSQIGVAQAGFHFDYKLGKTVGSVTISPLELTPLLTQTMPRPKRQPSNSLTSRRTGIGPPSPSWTAPRMGALMVGWQAAWVFLRNS